MSALGFRCRVTGRLRAAANDGSFTTSRGLLVLSVCGVTSFLLMKNDNVLDLDNVAISLVQMGGKRAGFCPFG